MKKIVIVLIVLMVISVGFFSGCTNQKQSIPIQNKSPSVLGSGNPTNGMTPLTVYFTGSGNDNDGYITSYSWDFGDGSSNNQQNSSHTFTIAGTYNVTLTVTDDDGATNKSSILIRCFSISGTHWTQNGIDYICQNYGDANYCVYSHGLKFVYLDTDEKNFTLVGATRDIVWAITQGMLLEVTNSQGVKISDPATVLNEANGVTVTPDMAIELELHDENSGNQWCYRPTNHSTGSWTQNGINHVCDFYGNDNRCVVSSGLVFNYTDIHGATGQLNGGTGDIIWLVSQDTILELTNQRGVKITNPKIVLDNQNGFEVTSSMAFELDKHTENSSDPWCYCSNC